MSMGWSCLGTGRLMEAWGKLFLACGGAEG